MHIETLRITWKIIRNAANSRTKKTYCSYLAENEKYKHKLKTKEGTKLFELLKTTIISKHNDRYEKSLYIDGVYDNDNNFLFIKNPRVL